MMSKDTKENANILVAMMMLSMCIIPSTNSVIIPETLGVKITSSLISRIIGNEWLGIEVKMLPEIKEKLSYLANEKKNA